MEFIPFDLNSWLSLKFESVFYTYCEDLESMQNRVPENNKKYRQKYEKFKTYNVKENPSKRDHVFTW